MSYNFKSLELKINYLIGLNSLSENFSQNNEKFNYLIGLILKNQTVINLFKIFILTVHHYPILFYIKAICGLVNSRCQVKLLPVLQE